MPEVEILDRNTPFKGFFSVETAKLRFRLHSGEMSPVVERTSVERGDSAVVLVRNTRSDRYVLLRQFRYACYTNGEPAWLLETVAGAIDAGESPEEAARRETLEECSLHVTRLEPIAVCYASPGTLTERYFIYAAEAEPAAEASTHYDAQVEDLELVECAINDLRGLLDRGEIRDAKTMICVQWLLAKQPNGRGSRP